jgi:cobalamin biosynthetic protein CobC
MDKGWKPNKYHPMSLNNRFDTFHGGDLSEAEKMFGLPPLGWLDLSTGVNLNPYPNVDLKNPSLHELPQRRQMETLLAAARRYYGVPTDIGIVAASGSQALLQCLPTLWSSKKISILGPTYAEHARAWAEGGHQVSIVKGLTDVRKDDIAVIVNPNNPDGRTVPPAQLLDLRNVENVGNGLLVLDEAFADTDPMASIIPQLQNNTVLVLRSFGKFFGLPGVRLGFAVGMPHLLERLSGKLGPWAVSGPAIEIGTRALNDTRWIKTTRIQLLERRNKLDAIILRAGLKILGGTNLFRLVHFTRAQEIFYHLGKAGVFVRNFPEHKTWLRLGVPGSEPDFCRLEEALSNAMSA